MYTIIGIKVSKGIYEGNAYDNRILHCTYTEPNNTNVDGVLTAILQVKAACCPPVTVGDCVDVLYDKYGNIAHVSVAK